MIITTRNFFLYLLCVAILIIAIAATALTRTKNSESAVEYTFPLPTEISSEATVIGAVTGPDRASRLARLREKVTELMVATPSNDESENVVAEEMVSVQDEVIKEPNICINYIPYQRLWQARDLSFTVVEGARLLSRAAVGTTTETVLQLPLRTYPLPTQSCLSSDVVAIALDGSLIRNNEVALYSIFGSDTLIGYALDGFPVYGVADAMSLDQCGGTMSEAGYRYYLESERSYLIGCYRGVPVELP